MELFLKNKPHQIRLGNRPLGYVTQRSHIFFLLNNAPPTSSWKGGKQRESTILGFVSGMDPAFSSADSCVTSSQWADFPETLQMWGQYFSTTVRLMFMETGQTKGLRCINVITRLCL